MDQRKIHRNGVCIIPKNYELKINDILLKVHKLGIQKSKDIASWTNTSLIVQKDDKIAASKPKYK